MRSYVFEAIDTLFFRDGTPFSSEGAAQAEVGGMFPPSPETVAGALRAGLARSNGWSEDAPRWPESLNPFIGDGPDDTGALRFTGPFVRYNQAWWFPAPRHLLGRAADKKWVVCAILGPGKPVNCDLGDGVRLPDFVWTANGEDPRQWRTPDGWWIKADALASLLFEGMRPRPSDFILESEMWSAEPRIGIALNPDTRTVREGMLYHTRHTRPSRGLSLVVAVDGIPPSWADPPNLLPLGGERRMASLSRSDVLWRPPAEGACVAKGGGPVTLVTLTPTLLPHDADVLVDAALGHGIRIVSACCDRPIRIGGWATLPAGDGRMVGSPRAVRSFLPAGSVLFVDIEQPEAWARCVGDDGFVRIGERTAFGFGLALAARREISNERR